MALTKVGLFVAAKMLLHNKPRLLLAVVGVLTAFFLTTMMVGLLVGWCNTTSAIVRNAGVDIWLMTPMTATFEYGTPIPDNYIYRARSVPGVDWAEGMLLEWCYWQRPDGKRVMILSVGLDRSLTGGPWTMKEGSVQELQRPTSVIVDELQLGELNVSALGDTAELAGRRMTLVGISKGVRTFTAAPFLFASIKTLRQAQIRYQPDEITYALVRCAPGADIQAVQRRIAAAVPTAEVLTTREFATRTIQYWIFSTGAGVTVVVCAILGLLVGMVIISQTLYASTLDHIGDYGTLLALGFSKGWLCLVVIAQSMTIGVLGTLLGAGLLAAVMHLSASTSIPVETTPLVFVSLVVITLMCCATASFMSIRAVLGIDPVSVFNR